MSSARQSVRHNARLAFTMGVREALDAPPARRQAEVRQVLRRNPGVALTFLNAATLRRVFLVLGYTATVATVATHWPAPPRGGVANMGTTAAGNITAPTRTWAQRAWNMAPSRTQAVNIGGAVASAVNPMFAIRWITASITSRTIDATDRQIERFEESANRARAQLETYLSWAMFVAFLALMSHFIPPIARNVRETINVFASGNAERVATLTGNTAQHAVTLGRSGGSRSRSRSRTRSRQRAAARTLRIGAGVPVNTPRRRLPTNAELLARLG